MRIARVSGEAPLLIVIVRRNCNFGAQRGHADESNGGREGLCRGVRAALLALRINSE